ncbi:MAG: UxaA family hydrolase [Chloroflexota bacterium]
MPTHPILFSDIGRLPHPDDNVAIATQILPAGTEIQMGEQGFRLDYTVLVGHRFAIKPIAPDEGLLSWGLPFGRATKPITPGQYVCNDGMIEALSTRSFDPDLGYIFPRQANFRDEIVPYDLSTNAFQAGVQVPRYAEPRTFMGYQRSLSRGVGTRNMIIVLGTTSSAASYVRALADSFQSVVDTYDNLDGIVPIAHTEGGGYDHLNNRDFLLRTLAGLIVHPNVGAVLIADMGTDTINNQVLQTYLQEQAYPLADVPHHFLTLSGSWEEDLAEGKKHIEAWLPQISVLQRTPQSVAHLSIALQCGGSDAFSGVSGNPLASSVVKEIIRYGGRANLAETDELIGSEAYVLQNIRHQDLAETFLDYIALFKARLSWHGQTAEGNPSGGNKYRGLYNIALKSIGAAMKRHPDVRLDHVVDYGERMLDPGYYFMNTPGNDLESIAGQVAGGSNLIIFVTGNGSITNFPFVPTIKVMTTTQRFALLSEEMDVNAGAYLDGTSMADLTTETLDLLVDIASGQPSKGEMAGHSQISIWRNWQQRDASQVALILDREKPAGRPIQIDTQQANVAAVALNPIAKPTPNIGLILPTSLCSGQVARLAANQLNATAQNPETGIASFSALVHTEGCGVAFASTREIYAQTMVGYALHPLVADCLFLEHGCEKAHNDYLTSLIHERGLTTADFGWASVQLDGGIENVTQKISRYFHVEKLGVKRHQDVSQNLTITIMLDGAISKDLARSLAQVTGAIILGGGSVVVPDNSGLLSSASFCQMLGLPEVIFPTLAYGQSISIAGFHVMEMPTNHWSETMTGLGATGVQVMLTHTRQARPAHPFIPSLVIGDAEPHPNFDVFLMGDQTIWFKQIMTEIGAITAGRMQPKASRHHNVDFQLTRGWLGIST